MKTRDVQARVVSEAAGSAAMICWLVILGPVGALLLLATAYAMIVGNSAWVAACVLLMLFPLALTLTWGILAWPALLTSHETERLEGFSPLARRWQEGGQPLAGQRPLE